MNFALQLTQSFLNWRNDMNKIDRLIAKYCPNGVEYKELETIATIDTGEQLNKNLLYDDGLYPVMNGGIYPSGRYNEYNTDKDNIAISQGGASAGYVNWMTENFWAGAHCYTVQFTTPKVLKKYVYYILKNNQGDFIKSQQGAGIPSLNRKQLNKLSIPVPPLLVQEEIVKILDIYTLLEAELEVNLKIEKESRKKQFEYYQDILLSFDNNSMEYGAAMFMPLSDVAKIYDGVHTTPRYTNTGVKFVSVANINNLFGSNKYISIDDYKKYKIHPQKGDVFMTRIGSIGNCAVVDKNEDLAYYVSLALIRPNKNKILSKYLKYVIESSVGKRELAKRILINAVPIKINLGEIGKIIIPVPSLDEQKRIVEILDKFDSLINDVSESLTIEIEVRKKQYEYYRNKLLTFKPLESEMY